MRRTKTVDHPALEGAKWSIQDALGAVTGRRRTGRRLTPQQVFDVAAFVEQLQHPHAQTNIWAMTSYNARQRPHYRWKCDAWRKPTTRRRAGT
jgi:hypothetical protein